DVVAERLQMTPDALVAEINEARAALYAARQQRPPPLRDDKLLTAWNGLMISALARAGFGLAEDRYLAAAGRAAGFVLQEARQGERLARHVTGGVKGPPGFLDDYAFMIQALLDLYEATGHWRWLEQAIGLQTLVDRELWDDAQGGYFFTVASPDLLVRDKPDYDGAEPAGNSVAALNLLRLAELTDRRDLRAHAERVLAAFARPLHAGLALPKMLSALAFYLSEPAQVVLVRPQAARDFAPLVDSLRRAFLPHSVRVLVQENDAAHAALVPLSAQRPVLSGRVTAYVCRGKVCKLPAQDADTLAAELNAAPPSS
ncbi:MAG: thioredoxin domain-containing protein, partial [Deltaproteobacteria bacterium]|nr:thioredoxin domain-containing protein [Deltaproteobacteria bacterium]